MLSISWLTPSFACYGGCRELLDLSVSFGSMKAIILALPSRCRWVINGCGVLWNSKRKPQKLTPHRIHLSFWSNLHRKINSSDVWEKTMRAKANSSTNSQEDAQRDRKLFSPAFPPTCALAVALVLWHLTWTSGEWVVLERSRVLESERPS